MTTLEVIALVTWLVGGLVVGVTMETLDQPPEGDGPASRGLRVLAGWVLAPLVVAGALVFGVCWLLGHGVGRVERVRPSRETLERRIRELEDETGMASGS